MLHRNSKCCTESKALFRSIIHVSVAALIIACPVLCGLFNSVNIDSGLAHYAETPYWGYRNSFLPDWLPMPANVLVNVGYLMIGLVWIQRVKQSKAVNEEEKYFFYSFCCMSVLYGFVQAARILTQSQWAGVLDQWYTFPIFAWGLVWCLYKLYGWNWPVILTVELLSVLSYPLSLLGKYGFELVLGLHILAIVIFATKVHQRFYTTAANRAYWMAVVCCAGFVILKLLDHTLAAWAPLPFAYLTGHFWSKIADFLQIHYICMFFIHSSFSEKKA